VLFNSFAFLIFAPLAFLGHRLLNGSARRVWLVFASFVFYGWANPWYVLLLVASTLLDFQIGKAIGASTDPVRRKRLLMASLIGNLGFLAVFKYSGFFARAFNDLIGAAGAGFEIPVPQILLPVGISFYTFQTLSYTIDVYRRQIPVERDFTTFALYVAYFPQLVAGPIERAGNLLPQLGAERRLPDRDDALTGITRILWGLLKKVVFADWLAVYVNDVFGRVDAAHPLELLLAINAFAFQIYLDFSAYSDIAIGLARLFGVRLMENFRWPYLARNIGEFWRRWHISLSTWLRDYLYIPLGGSRAGAARTLRNFLIVMFLGGLWHGAEYTFVLWGLWIGVALVVHQLWTRLVGTRLAAVVPAAVSYLPAVLLTYATMLGAWVLFRADDLPQALAFFGGLAPSADWSGTPAAWQKADGAEAALRTALLLGCAMLAHVARGLGFPGSAPRRAPDWSYGAAWAALVTLMALLHAPVGEKFIYFQF
jgi:alginate O-acetyltransferase complex protein AlgI